MRLINRFKYQIFTLAFLFSSQTFSANCRITPAVANQIKANTFMIIPINTYASVIPEENARKYHAQNCNLSNLPVSEKMNCDVLKDCKGESCIRPYSSHGTAFLLGNGRTLLTAWHVVFQTHAAALLFLAEPLSALSPEEKTKAYKNLKPEFILLNQKNEIVYDTRDSENKETQYELIEDPLSTVFSLLGRKNNQAYGYYENISPEKTIISLQKNLGRGLNLSQRPIDPRCIHTAGFGYDSYKLKFDFVSGRQSSLSVLNRSLGIFMDFQLTPLPMSREEFEKLSTGKILELMGYSQTDVAAQLKKYTETQLRSAIKSILDTQARHAQDLKVSRNKQSLYFTAPVLSGFSGGPAFNNQGEIIGLTTNAFMKKDKKTGRQISIGGASLLIK